MQLKPTDQTPLTVASKYQVYVFTEYKNFRVLKGAYRKAANDESVAGDTFSFLDLDNGRTVLMLADGMGTGEEAEQESKYLVETMGRLLETGISEKQAIRLVNAMMSFSTMGEQFSTLDICSFHKASGNGTFLKMGASTTFIKRDGWVDAISSTTLPMGTLDDVKMDVSTRKLYSGDMVIMISDGVMDGVDKEDKEGFLKELIGQISARQPNEFCRELVELVRAVGGGRVEDDMSAMTLLII